MVAPFEGSRKMIEPELHCSIIEVLEVAVLEVAVLEVAVLEVEGEVFEVLSSPPQASVTIVNAQMRTSDGKGVGCFGDTMGQAHESRLSVSRPRHGQVVTKKFCTTMGFGQVTICTVKARKAFAFGGYAGHSAEPMGGI